MSEEQHVPQCPKCKIDTIASGIKVGRYETKKKCTFTCPCGLIIYDKHITRGQRGDVLAAMEVFSKEKIYGEELKFACKALAFSPEDMYKLDKDIEKEFKKDKRPIKIALKNKVLMLLKTDGMFNNRARSQKY